MPAQKLYAVMRTYADGTAGWNNPRSQWEASKTRTTDLTRALAMADRLEAKPRNRMLGWHFYAARIA